MEERTNNLVIQEACDLQQAVFLSDPEIPSTIAPLDLSIPISTASLIDLTNDEPSPPESPNDCVAILPSGSNENDDTLDESISIVYENIKPPPDLNVEVDQSGDIVVELLKRHSEPYSGYLTKKVKLGPSNVNVCVTVNTVKKTSISDPTNPVAQRMRGKISISNLLGTQIPTPQIESPQSQSTSASSSNSTVDCGICLDSYSEIVASDRNLMSTSCGHVFCNECIEKCRANYKQCPKCRKRLTKKSYHPLYLS